MTTDEYWQKFLKEKNKKPDLKYNGEFQFGMGDDEDSGLLGLVISGRKTAVTSSLYSFDIDMERVPKKGDYYIITDNSGNPVCIIHEVNVQVTAFKDVTWEYAQKEGEDENISQWRNSHIDFFMDEGDIMGYEFSEDMPVVLEEFEVVYR
ncbi:MAG: ASCH domain-containing protein [Treponema sp.]|nr:ASCH domain-containing protein [Treponema sp.]